MASEGSRLCLLCACLCGLIAGCTSVPPVPASARNQSKPDADDYDGWLGKKLMGKGVDGASGKDSSNSAASSPGASVGASGSQVQTASYVAPNASNVSGASTASGNAVPNAQAPPLNVDPPPSLPQELPPPPAGAVSLPDYVKKKDEKSGFEWSDLEPENIWKNLKVAAGYGPDEKIARAAMKEGRELFEKACAMSAASASSQRQALFREAAAKFATAADRWPDTPLEEDALFLEGESEYWSDQYPKAHDTYGGLLKKFSRTRHLETVMAREFRMGQYWEQLHNSKPLWTIQPNITDRTRPWFDTFGYAIQAYDRVQSYDHDGPLGDHSVMSIANAYFRDGQYNEASYNYDLLCKDYPKSGYQKKAHLLNLQSKIRIYQGTAYDGNPLKDAEKIADRTLSQFGSDLGDERERVVQTRMQIIEERASRDFVRGEYYEQKKYYGAARMYYKGVIEEFPGTEKAREARERYDKIRNLPDQPPDRWKWLREAIDKR